MKNINIGENIANYRQRAGMTQDQLAAYAGVSKSAVSKWENGASHTKGYQKYNPCLPLAQLTTNKNPIISTKH